LLGLGAFSQRAEATSPKVIGEAVDHYQGTASDISCIPEMDNFRNGLLNAPGTIFTAGNRFVDQSVFDVDFYDLDLSPGINGSEWFDQPTTGVGYVSVHGVTGPTSTQACTSHNNCTAPPPGQSLPGACIANVPGTAGGWCAYRGYRAGLVGPSPANAHSQLINYQAGQVKWGESPNAGSWAGAGINGGLNFAALVTSYTVGPNDMLASLGPIFAGMTLLGVVMPITPQSADDVDAPVRGTAFSNAYKTNPNGSIGLAWAGSIAGIPANDGAGCGNSGGGGHGINSCGAQVTFSMDVNPTKLGWNLTQETWNDIIRDDVDAVAAAWYSFSWMCNYNCNTANWNL